jgi:glycosyltransferase involved in cell wall biosynthesis
VTPVSAFGCACTDGQPNDAATDGSWAARPGAEWAGGDGQRTPVVASRLDALPEVVRDGETGFLVTPGDVEELRDRLAQLLADPGLTARMGSRAREVVVEFFTWDACAQRCLAGYAELMQRG